MRQRANGRQAIDLGHVHVNHRHVWPVLARQLHSLLTVSRQRHHLNIVLERHHQLGALAELGVVVGDEQTNDRYDGSLHVCWRASTAV